ncbi:hypothetical protein [Nocardiopsis alborubida]|uniref:Uncharacterized protein n=1 Tax=Nocardiopsis alborubida TaxID=146802 RepID=A0A7X6MB50_9ACTN|nr:hypothetical protein [Nocardiopsis alborubida]NKY96763.1 hypothetical protein [Nocardiopsis alborubida]
MIAQPHHHRARGDIRFMIQPGTHPQNIRVDDDGRLWGEVPVVPFREVTLDPVLLNTGVRSTRAAARTAPAPREPEPHAPDDVPGYQLRPDPLEARTVEEFVEMMRRYRRWAGSPSYRVMARRVGTCSAAGFCEALSRDRDRLPSFTLLNAFVVSLGGDQEYFRRWVTAWRSLDGRVAGEPLMLALPPVEGTT